MTDLPRAGRALLLFGAVGASFFTVKAAGQPLSEDAKLLPGDGAPDDQFGWSIAVDNGTVAVGAFGDDDNGANSGSAYLFDAVTGAPITKLLPSDLAAGDQFGLSIAIGDGVVAVGSYLDDDNGAESGSAYLFDAVTGAQITKLLPGDGAADDWFGWSIAIGDGMVAVGAYLDDDNGSNSGSAYVFDAATGVQITKLLPNDAAVNDWFGLSIAIDDGMVAVGAIGDDDNGNNSGSAYVFDAVTGNQLAKLVPGDGVPGDRFGRSISIDNGVVAVGAFLADDNGSTSGSAYVFDAATGTQVAKLLPGDGAERDRFGHAIGIDSGVVVVGVPYDADNGGASGSAYLFDAATGHQLAKLLPSDGASGDRFGRSIAIGNGIVAVGAYGDDDNGAISGSAYVVDVRCPGAVSADLNGDGVLDNADIGAFVTLFLAGDLEADLSGDGVVDNGDILAFVSLFLAGC